jgi:hypothetical protein
VTHALKTSPCFCEADEDEVDLIRPLGSRQLDSDCLDHGVSVWA